MATGANRYIWTPAANLDDASLPNPVASINATTQFTVTGTTLAGCSATDTITVEKSAGGNANFSMPNAFTPNNDGKNDCFGVGRFGDITLEEFSVYNRWGQKVFTTKNPSECWNGFSQGRPLETGGYGYKIKGKSSCGIIDFKGIVMLIR
jgi:gliding motility-associated-like protein